MPSYSYKCNNKKCGLEFEEFMTMDEYDRCKILCPRCRTKATREFLKDLPATSVKLSNDQIKLGHLAQRNSEKLSNDERNHLNYEHNKYKYEEPTKDLPSGMTRTKKFTNKKQVRTDRRKIIKNENQKK